VVGCEAAQDTVGSQSSIQTRGTADSSMANAAIALYASASAREVRFATQPFIRVRLCGAIMDSVHVIERRNLPERIQPGMTYRDVFISVEILGHLNARCLANRITGSTDSSATCAALRAKDSSGLRRSPL
jgi:hypothetical protein